MDALGQRIVREREIIAFKRSEAARHEWLAAFLRREADEMERLLELAQLGALR